MDGWAASSVVGEMLLLAIVAAVGVGVFIAIPDPPIEDRTASLEAYLDCGDGRWATGDERVVVAHRGGQQLRTEAARLLVSLDGIQQEYALPSAFDIGDEWQSPRQTLLANARAEFVVTYLNPDGSSTTVEDRLASRLVCGALGSSGMVFMGGFPVLPFLDRDCDGDYDDTDDLLPLSELADGTYATPDGVCLAVPPGVPDIVALEVRLTSPNGGIWLANNATSTSSDVILESPGGRVVATKSIVAAGDVVIRGTGVDLTGANVEAERGTILVDSGGGDLVAPGASFEAGARNNDTGTVPVVDLPDQSGPGSIRFCVVIMDARGYITNGWQFDDLVLNVSGRAAPPNMTDHGVLPATFFEPPLLLNADVLFNDNETDARCVTYNDLELGNWFYAEETVSNATDWRAVRYNDQLSISVQTLNDFFEYSPELFTPDPNDDAGRDQNADGHIVLGSSRPFRTLIVLNQFDGEREAEISFDSRGGRIDLSAASIVAHDSDIVIRTRGGDLLAPWLVAHALGDEAQIFLWTEGGLLRVDNADVLSVDGVIHLRGDGGLVSAVAALVDAEQSLTATSSSRIDVTDATFRSRASNLVLDGVQAGSVVVVQGAAFEDLNDKADVEPLGAVIVGVPAYGGTE